ncbi:DUF3558 domain-containing protein [Nocardia salmonicida]|uniref:DUF3558 domain-containing protein n=1 Tax=Nocardia salmonicida TaxID=53431 RepID=A0ABZ1N9H3_9NOCA
MSIPSRPFLIALCASVFAAGCSIGGGGTTGSAVPEVRSYSALPSSCEEVDAEARESLSRFAGYLEDPDARLQAADIGTPLGANSLICTVSFDTDPVPVGEVMPAAGPLLRTVTIELERGPVLPPRIHTTRTPMASNAVEREHFSTPRRLDGIGDDAMISEQDQAGAMRSWATALVGNVRLEVVTSGMDWSGGATPPVWRSPTMLDDLSSGAEAILADLADSLPETLPIATTEPPSSTPTAHPGTKTTAAPVPVWDPCGIPESAITAMGLDPSKKESGTGGHCRWHGDKYTVEILSGTEPFHEVYYSHYGWYPTPRPTKILDRRALMVTKAFGGAGADVDDGYCELGFDTPFGAKNGIPTGHVSIELWDTVDREPAAVCKDLARLAEPLVAHLPPSR